MYSRMLGKKVLFMQLRYAKLQTGPFYFNRKTIIIAIDCYTPCLSQLNTMVKEVSIHEHSVLDRPQL